MKRKLIKRTGIFILFSLFFGLICNLSIVANTDSYLYNNTEEIPYREYGLVLGTVKEGKKGVNLYFKYRMESAAELYFSGKVSKLIVSGDNHVSAYNETEDMANYLISLGVPENKIIKDYAGFRTLDSVIRAKKVFNCQNLTIISQKFHNQRAVFIARQHDIDAIGLNAQDISKNNLVALTREFFAKTLVVLDVFVFNREPKFL